MDRKHIRQQNRRRKIKRALIVYGAIPITGALVFPLILGGTSSAVNSHEQINTVYQAAVKDAQHYVTSSTIVLPTLDRESYSATTSTEIDEKHAAEAAAAKAAADALVEAEKKRLADLNIELKKRQGSSSQAQLAQSGGTQSFVPKLNYSMVAAGSGEVRWPLPADTWKLGSRLGDGRNHQGIDMAASEGTPLYAAAAGTVIVAQNNYSAYGTTVELSHVIAGQQIRTLYAHMPLNSNAVKVGDKVEAGQLIGYVGNTGRSYGAHLHLEVRLNGTVIDGFEWLTANAS